VCIALGAYCTFLLRCRQTAKHFERSNDLIGETYCSVWKRDLQLLLIMQVLFVIMIITAGVLDISQAIRELYEFHTVLLSMLYYVSELAGFMPELQFVAFMHILKRTVQNWNSHIDVIGENDDVNNRPWY